MAHPITATIAVPATTANIGPGFDCLGAALALYNTFTFSRLTEAPLSEVPSLQKTANSSTVKIVATGQEADRVQLDATNLAYQSFLKVFEKLGQPAPPIQLQIQLGVPLARGLGSSATAIVGGLLGANALADSPLSRLEVMELAIALEGHPDNVVPALLGGCQLSATSPRGWEICEVPWHNTVTPIVAIPNFELSTAEARRVLPTNYSRADAIFNTAHLALLVRGLDTGNPTWLGAALHDRIHQPYRQSLIPGYEAVESAALAAGAYGLVISGAGPTLLALANLEQAATVQAAIAQTWASQAIPAEVKILALDRQGASIQLKL